MGMLKEFREFAVKGNVVDLAVGIIIGGAFGKIVSSLVGDVVMPSIGLLIGGVDFSGLQLTIGQATIKYGVFIQSVVDFTIVAFSIFLVIKALNAMKKQQQEVAPPPAPPTNEEKLLAEIRDLLKSGR